MATFNGYLIVPMPSSPAPRSIEWNATDAVAALVSPFSGQQQIQNWQAGWLSASVTMPPMKDSHARAWVGQRRRSDRFHAGHQRLDSERRGRSAAGRFTSDRVPPLYKSDGAERRRKRERDRQHLAQHPRIAGRCHRDRTQQYPGYLAAGE